MKTTWNKKKNEKKLPLQKLKQFGRWVQENRPSCQIRRDGCTKIPEDTHHLLFGSSGADKDDRTLVSVCRVCHLWCHANKRESIELFMNVANNNWEGFSNG